ncbi:MAG TPA: transporter [Candidatus Binatus sp.]|nr:transporter [Candidatus Binatus sp.]
MLRVTVVSLLAALIVAPHVAAAEELTPRSYAAAPVGGNLFVIGYSTSWGAVLTDPELPVSNVNASIDRTILGYVHTFALAKHTANVQFLLPYTAANLNGTVGGTATTAQRWGYSDLVTRIGWNLIGDPALSPAQFVRRTPKTTVGASLTVVVPTGAYNPARLINVGQNRWAFLPEAGFETPIKKWFVDGSAGAWFFTNNNNFFGGHVRSQSPVLNLQALGGYEFRPGFWLSAGGVYYGGGQTSLDGAPNHDTLINGRYGLDLNVPVNKSFSTRVSWTNWLTATAGGQFRTIALKLQYRWFDR